VTLRARWVTLRARWVTLRARWVTLRARWVTLRARWVTFHSARRVGGVSAHARQARRPGPAVQGGDALRRASAAARAAAAPRGRRPHARPAAQVSAALTAMEKWRIVTGGVPGGRSLTGPFRDARRFTSTRSTPYRGRHEKRGVWGCSRTILCRPVPNLSDTIRNFCIAVRLCSGWRWACGDPLLQAWSV
jgi:hypothetical protein